MISFCGDECATLYEALVLYRETKVQSGTREDNKCDLMLSKLAPYRVINDILPGYRVECDT